MLKHLVEFPGENILAFDIFFWGGVLLNCDLFINFKNWYVAYVVSFYVCRVESVLDWLCEVCRVCSPAVLHYIYSLGHK